MISLRDFAEKIFHKLPLRIRMILLNTYYAMRSGEIYTSPDHFPLNYIMKMNLPIFGKSEQEGYFYRYYQEKEVVRLLSPEDLFKFKYEVIYGELINNRKIEISCDEDYVFPISLENERDVLTITYDDNLSEKQKNLASKRFHYFNADKGSKYEIESEKGFVIGKPICLKQKKAHSKKLVLCLFIDGLAHTSQINFYSLKQLMPNTSVFFSEGVKFENHYSNAEWTLPSVPSFFTGRRQQGHGFFGPKEPHRIGEGYKILSEIFKENEYLTFQASGNWRMSPAYGYIKGFDRSIYKKEMDAKEIIYSFLEHMRAFKGRDNFAWLSITDVHHLLSVIPDVSNQVANKKSICVTPWYDPDNKAKSVFTSKNDNLIEIYINEIKRLDYYLKIIYDYIEDNYSSDEILVTLVSDHGQAFLTSDQHPLSVARTKVPWLIRGEGIPRHDSYEFTENIDVFSTLIKCCELESYEDVLSSQLPTILGGKAAREYVFRQSIYPGQTYKAVIRDEFCEYRFESNQAVKPTGSIGGGLEIVDTLHINESEKKQVEQDSEKYKKIILSRIEEWNDRF